MREIRSPKPPVTLADDDDDLAIFSIYVHAVYSNAVDLSDLMTRAAPDDGADNNDQLVIRGDKRRVLPLTPKAARNDGFRRGFFGNGSLW